MGRGKSSFNMSNGFNGYGDKTYLKAREYNTYFPLSQENVRPTPDFGQFVQKALGGIAITDSSYNSKLLLKALGGVSSATPIQIKKDKVTGKYLLSYHISSTTAFTSGAYLHGNSKE